jgi:hypothetical protein
MEGINENFFKNIFEKFLDLSNHNTSLNALNNITNPNNLPVINPSNPSSNKREQIPMLKSCDEDGFGSLNNLQVPSPQNLNELNLPFRSNSNMSNNNIRNSPIRTYNDPKMDIDDQNNILFRNPSPNPFLDDLNYSQSNIFGSPRGDGFPFFSRNQTENTLKNEDSEANMNNMLCLNGYNQMPLSMSRNNSMDLNELYKNNLNMKEEEYNKKMIDNNYVFDDSYFSVSSDKNNKSENKSMKSEDLN